MPSRETPEPIRRDKDTARPILLVEDDAEFRELLYGALSSQGIACDQAENLSRARDLLQRTAYPVVVVDQHLPDGAGIDLVRQLAAQEPGTQVIVISGVGEVSLVVEAMQAGAFDYLLKPFDIQELFVRIDRAFERGQLQRREALLKNPTQGGQPLWPVSRSPAMKELQRLVDVYAEAAPTSVLIIGETGVGKERAARSLYQRSARANQPFVAANCANFDGSLVDSELFGHEKGAFTGALGQKTGLFELADGGTLFLDELCEMPLSSQAKLLRALEDRAFRRVGGTREIRSDFWLISATNVNPEQAVKEGKLRQDLYYRLSTLTLRVPPLRERYEDIPDLIHAICAVLIGKNAERVRLTEGTLEVFQRYDWPGNVRELRNVIEHALIVNKDYVVRAPEEMIATVRASGDGADRPSGRREALASSFSPIRPLREVEDEARMAAISAALKANGGNRSAAARNLDISLSTFKRMLKRYELD